MVAENLSPTSTSICGQECYCCFVSRQHNCENHATIKVHIVIHYSIQKQLHVSSVQGGHHQVVCFRKVKEENDVAATVGKDILTYLLHAAESFLRS